MHPALSRLVEANSALEAAEQALGEAQERRRQAALGLSDIEDQDERWQAALSAYRQFGKGLSLALAEAATGLPGRQAQSTFLVRAGRKQNQPKGRWAGTHGVANPVTEWPAPDALERDLIRSHISHRKPYWLDRGLGWGQLRLELNPADAAAYLEDPTGALASRVGLSRELFIEWLSSEGSVPCDGVTLKGSACKAGVAGLSSQLAVEPWKAAKERGGYCRRHGG